MKALIIGLGSMGKRRIRCLKKIGIEDIIGYDTREDRKREAAQRYNIQVCKEDIEEYLELNRVDLMIISTPPDLHTVYANLAIEHGINTFIEASVTDIRGLKQIESKIKGSKLKIYPSCTMKYFPGPKIIKEAVKQNKVGNVLYFNYQSGQYLPDWHPWESIQDYYVSQRKTGGARELVPFELTWLNDIFGDPDVISSIVTKIGKINADIDDYYGFILKYKQILANITIEVLSRPQAIRNLEIIGDEGRIHYSEDEKIISIRNEIKKINEVYKLEEGEVEDNYINPEEPYIEEIKDFINAIKVTDPVAFPNSLQEDVKILELLEDIEKANG